MGTFNTLTYANIIFIDKYGGGAAIRAGAAIRRYTVYQPIRSQLTVIFTRDHIS